MNPTRQLHDLGQRIWLDNITREMLASGTLGGYIRDLSVTGLTSNPTIFEHALRSGSAYDETIRRKRVSMKKQYREKETRRPQSRAETRRCCEPPRGCGRPSSWSSS